MPLQQQKKNKQKKHKKKMNRIIEKKFLSCIVRALDNKH